MVSRLRGHVSHPVSPKNGETSRVFSPQNEAPAGAGAGRCVAQLLLYWFRLGVLAAEALDSAGGIHKLLLAGEERMAGRADFYVDVAFMGRSCGKAAAARAHNAYFVVSGMDGCLHGVSKLIRDIRF